MDLLKFTVRRTLASIPVLFGVSVITFGLVHLTPGDVVSQLVAANPDASQADAVRLRREFGLDDPVWVQYINWLGDVLTGDFGEHFTSGRDVSALVWARLPETLALGLFGWVFALLIAIPGGIYAAINRGEIGDDVSRFAALSGISIPNFWLGLMLIAVFSVQLNLFPTLDPQEPLLSTSMLWWLVLPGVTIGTAASANLMRIMRTSMAEELNKEYVTAARAKGLPERTVVLKHVLRNSLISVTTIAAFLTASIVSGSVVVETVFGWPGLGILFVEAINVREINLILVITLFTGVFIVLANLLADIVYALLDPRIRHDY
ncbi:peptide/nickel transport system permease protein [Halorubrum alkaliphilum]|uniref:Peptide/nickel transport system permease protein n=1 Tax=Halorubrum alkaliphilum TaxID=261290 RepID=A0A8T4GDT6_9EURY|nr:ABC transporter permease [Halorubrum alkaliphilum]MBP1922306.1 peptide/nickel transport system permease protein [Halorubrum alkaliphilum]